MKSLHIYMYNDNLTVKFSLKVTEIFKKKKVKGLPCASLLTTLFTMRQLLNNKNMLLMFDFDNYI